MDYSIVRSKRKTVAIDVYRDCSVKVRAPLRMAKADIDNFVKRNISWIEKQQAKHSVNKENAIEITEAQIKQLKISAKEILSQKTEYFSSIMNVQPKGVKITSATTCWGSCSYVNSICYSYRVMLLDDECQNYIVVHELSHIKQKNHSAAFYAEIEKIIPDYRRIKNKIKDR